MKQLLIIVFASLSITVLAQKNNTKKTFEKPFRVPLVAENWNFKAGVAEFITHRSVPALKINDSSAPVVLKNFTFTNGTIEYDFEPLEPDFTSIYFRWKNESENECFYFRNRAGNASAIDAIQYAPLIKGINMWDALYHFQAKANFELGKWNHVKLVISGKQMLVFVNDMDKVALKVPYLEGDNTSGTLAFDGKVAIANLVVKANVTEGLSPQEGVDPTSRDSSYIRKWQISPPISTAKNIDFSYDYIPNAETKWEDITAERRGLMNLTRKFGKTDERRIVWLKADITSSENLERKLHLGFSDEVWVFINQQPLYIDKNLYNTPMMKKPDGRCSVENTSFNVPLKKGNNTLLIGVANNFYAWGIVARFDDIEGIALSK